MKAASLRPLSAAAGSAHDVTPIGNGITASYHAVGDFEQRPGAVTKNASGLALSLGLGVAWGR